MDSAGNAYVTGGTYSPDFPTTPGAFQGTHGGDIDAFVVRLDPSGSALLYSTILGGMYNDWGYDWGYGIVMDSADNAYVTGGTSSNNFPTTPGAFQGTKGGHFDAFIAKLSLPASLALGLNQTAFRPGESLVLTATVFPWLPLRAVDAYVALRLPEGTLLFLQGDGRFTPGTRPFVTNWTLANFSGEIFRYTFGGKEPLGQYAWLAAFTEPGTLNLLGGIVEVPFRRAP